MPRDNPFSISFRYNDLLTLYSAASLPGVPLFFLILPQTSLSPFTLYFFLLFFPTLVLSHPLGHPGGLLFRELPSLPPPATASQLAPSPSLLGHNHRCSHLLFFYCPLRHPHPHPMVPAGGSTCPPGAPPLTSSFPPEAGALEPPRLYQRRHRLLSPGYSTYAYQRSIS